MNKRSKATMRIITVVRDVLALMLCVTMLVNPLFGPSALATTQLPESLKQIEDEAFECDVSLVDMVLPEGLVSIGSRAFAETSLKTLSIPASVTEIDDSAFEDVCTPMLIQTVPGCMTVHYALRHDLDFRANTKCRALLIGQTDYPEKNRLCGPSKDIVKIMGALEGYDITTRSNLVADEILEAIDTTFGEATNDDISLLFYSGHGSPSDGSLIGIDMESYVSPFELRAALDGIPGRKIVIIDACYSGAFIGRSLVRQDEANTDVSAAFIRSFTARRPLLFTSLAAQQYFVMASSKSDELSWESSQGGVFTGAFVDSREFGDEDSDGVVTFDESYQYAKNQVNAIVSASNLTQSVQVYPEDCNWFGLFRYDSLS